MTDNIFQRHDGYAGMFTRGTAPGAIPNGSRIVKIRTEEGDFNPVGALGTVLGSMRAPSKVRQMFPGNLYFYFVEWDAMPKCAVGVVSSKIAMED